MITLNPPQASHTPREADAQPHDRVAEDTDPTAEKAQRHASFTEGAGYLPWRIAESRHALPRHDEGDRKIYDQFVGAAFFSLVLVKTYTSKSRFTVSVPPDAAC